MSSDAVNQLDLWRDKRRLTIRALCEALEINEKSGRRYLLPLDHAEYREPVAAVRRRIIDFTQGEVTAEMMMPMRDAAA